MEIHGKDLVEISGETSENERMKQNRFVYAELTPSRTAIDPVEYFLAAYRKKFTSSISIDKYLIKQMKPQDVSRSFNPPVVSIVWFGFLKLFSDVIRYEKN